MDWGAPWGVFHAVHAVLVRCEARGLRGDVPGEDVPRAERLPQLHRGRVLTPPTRPRRALRSDDSAWLLKSLIIFIRNRRHPRPHPSSFPTTPGASAMEDLARSLGIAPAAPSPSPSSSSSSDMSTRPTRREARDILRALGVPVASESDILWISTPTPYRAGRPRLVVLTSHLLVYLRGLDQFQAAYNRAMDAKKTWDIDWTGAVENLAYAGEAWDDAEMTNGANNNNNNNASPLAPPTLAEVVHMYIPSLTFMNQVVPSTTTNTHHGVNVTDDDRTELLSVHFRPRDAWLGDPSSTRMR